MLHHYDIDREKIYAGFVFIALTLNLSTTLPLLYVLVSANVDSFDRKCLGDVYKQSRVCAVPYKAVTVRNSKLLCGVII